MATPYVVPKLPLSKSSGDFDRCVGEPCTGGLSDVGDGSCRYSCSSWCPVCERRSEADRRDVLTKSFVDGLRKVDGGLHDGLKTLQPVINKLNSQVVSEKLSNLTQKTTLFVSPVKDKGETAAPPLNEKNGIHDKYVREVECLKDKIQELRDNLSRQFSETESFISSIPKLLWNKESCVSTVTGEDENSAPLEPSKRTKRLSETDNSTSLPVPVAQKRPRDFSPDLNGIICDKPVNHIQENHVVEKQKLDVPAASTAKNNKPSFNLAKFKDSTSPSKDHKVKTDIRSSLPAHTLNTNCSSIPVIDHFKESDLKHTKLIEVSKELHPALRPSLFPDVPPYIRFVSHDSQVNDPLPPNVSKVLRWRITTITPLVVRKTVINSGFKLVKQSPDWTGTWGKHMKSVMFRTIRENQKINHFPGTFQIGRKDKLWKNLHHLMLVYSRQEFGFIPRTFVLPQDVKLLRVAWERDGGTESTWIVKPPASARGTGIKVVNKWSQIPKKTPIIVQKYISNPYLINGNKFDLRLYALVTSFNPLRIYLYDNGLVRFASVKYSEDLSSLSDRYMHLTNYSINKLSNNYHHNEDADACQGHKWTIKTLFTYLQEKIDVKVLWDRLVDLVIKTMMCGEASICQLSLSNLTSHYCSYELFGVDVLLDENLTPWLLEVNISPSLHSASPLDLAVKGPLIKDILNIAGYQVPDQLTEPVMNDLKPKLGLNEDQPLCYNKNLYVAGLSPSEREKQKEFIDMDRREYIEAILKHLTPDDIRHLIRYEDELTQIGSFEKVFPTTDSYEYLKFFESPQYYNKLFDAWETKYSCNRLEGVKRLQDLCKKGCHLDILDVALHVSPSASKLAEAIGSSTEINEMTEKSEPSEQRSEPECPSAALKVPRRRRKVVNAAGRPYGRYNKARLRRPRSS